MVKVSHKETSGDRGRNIKGVENAVHDQSMGGLLKWNAP